MASVRYCPFKDDPSKKERVEVRLTPPATRRSEQHIFARQNLYRLFNGKYFLMALTVIVVFFCFLRTAVMKKNIDLDYDFGSLEAIKDNFSICYDNRKDARQYIDDKPIKYYQDFNKIYFVTATYPRPEQIPQLTRLAHTLINVPEIHWIVADDRPTCNAYMQKFLEKFKIPYTYIASPMPKAFDLIYFKPKGIANHRSGLQYIREEDIVEGVLYFGDEDNVYDLQLFKEIRDTKTVSMFPTALFDSFPVNTPIVRKNHIQSMLNSWLYKNKWAVDLAGFAVNLNYLSKYPLATFPYKSGVDVDNFLKQINLDLKMIEPKASKCTEVYVWHVRTLPNTISYLKPIPEYRDLRNNLHHLYKNLDVMGIARVTYRSRFYHVRQVVETADKRHIFQPIILSYSDGDFELKPTENDEDILQKHTNSTVDLHHFVPMPSDDKSSSLIKLRKKLIGEKSTKTSNFLTYKDYIVPTPLTEYEAMNNLNGIAPATTVPASLPTDTQIEITQNNDKDFDDEHQIDKRSNNKQSFVDADFTPFDDHFAVYNYQPAQSNQRVVVN